jgi:predicted AlkP superfamily phosphohydrolase/phosphomutase
VAAAIGGFVDPKTGRSPVKKVWRREEVFKGKHLDTAPDLLFEPAEGYSLTHAKAAVEDADWVSGDHRIDGVIVARGPHVKPNAFVEPAALVDVAPTILAALDAPSSVEHTGKVLTQLLGDRPALRATEPAATIPGMPTGDDSAVSDTEADEMEEHLRGLGYLE